MGKSKRGGGGGDNLSGFFNSPNRPIMYSIFIAIILFFLFQFGLIYQSTAGMDDHKLTLEAEIHARQRRNDELSRSNADKERENHRWQRKINESEQKWKSINQRQKNIASANSASITLFLITPTYARPTQKADLTRLSYTLMHVSNLFWIVVEDATQTSNSVAELLKRSKIPNAQIAVSTPDEFKLNETDPNWLKPRGVEQRNAGLAWLRTNMMAYAKNAVVYFADDDNTYDLRLFDEMRDTKLVSVWPVGLVGGLLVERPLINEEGRVYDWMVGWKRDRPFPLDMAGFATNLSLFFRHPDAQFTYDVPRGYQESHLLAKLSITRDQLVPKADNCTKVYVWHTRTEKAKLRVENYWRKKGYRSDDGIEV